MNISLALRNSIIAGVFLLLFVPLVISETMAFPYITGKNFSFRILVEILFAGWVVLAVFDARYRPRASFILAGLSALVLWMLFANLFSENVFKSFFSNFERMDGWITLLHIFLYYIVAISVFTKESLWWWFWHISILVATVIGVIGLADVWQYITTGVGESRVFATLGNPIYLAVYSLFHIFIAAMYMAQRSLKWHTLSLYVSFIVLQISLVYFSATRGTILGLLGGAFLGALLLSFFSEKKTVRMLGVGLFASVIFLVGAFFLAKESAFVQESPVLGRLASISLEDNTTKARLMNWQMAFEGVKERPIVGWGQESYNYVFNKYYNPQMYAQEQWFDRAHNVFFDWLIAGGVPALLLYLSLYAFALYYLWFYKREGALFSNTERAILTGLLAGYAFHNLFVFDILVSLFFFASVLAYIHTRVTPDNASLFAHVEISRSTALDIFAPIVLVLLVVCVYTLNVPGIQNAKDAIRVSVLEARGDIPGTREIFEEVYARGHIGRQEIAEQMTQMAYRVARKSEISQEERNAVIQSARAMMEQEITHAPNDARLYLFLGSFLTNIGMLEEGRKYLLKAHQLSPKKQTILFELGLNSINQNDIETGLGYLEDAFMSAPEFAQARILYAIGLMFADRIAEAESILTEGFGTAVVDDENLLRAYARKGFWAQAIAIQQMRVSKDSENLQLRMNLAAIYLESGDTESARQVLRKAQSDFPQAKENLERFIEEL